MPAPHDRARDSTECSTRSSHAVVDNAFPVLTATRRRSLFFNWVPAIDRNNLPSQRMSIFPDHVLQRFPEPELQNMLTAPGYI